MSAVSCHTEFSGGSQTCGRLLMTLAWGWAKWRTSEIQSHTFLSLGYPMSSQQNWGTLKALNLAIIGWRKARRNHKQHHNIPYYFAFLSVPVAVLCTVFLYFTYFKGLGDVFEDVQRGQKAKRPWSRVRSDLDRLQCHRHHATKGQRNMRQKS